VIEDDKKLDSESESRGVIDKEIKRKAKPKAKPKKAAVKKSVVNSKSSKKVDETKEVTKAVIDKKVSQKKSYLDNGILPPPNMLIKFRNDIVPVLMKEFNYNNVMEAPALSKVVLNIGMGSEAIQNSKSLDAAVNDIAIITGQKPVVTRARKSIAAFKLREGMPIGVSVTLRRRKMYEFMERFIGSALPRIRDFRGLNRKCFDGRGNCTIGIKEQVIFPEIDYNSIDKLRGLQVIICTSANNDVEGIRFLELLGMPFIKK
tara:strand:- start:14809 stop:15588 length:780 start_codon:yes stop_codon:yes gene_type:complete